MFGPVNRAVISSSIRSWMSLLQRVKSIPETSSRTRTGLVRFGSCSLAGMRRTSSTPRTERWL